MWISRLTELILNSQEPVLVEDNSFGLSEAASSLITSDGRTLWIELDASSHELLRNSAWGLPVRVANIPLIESLRMHQEFIQDTVRPILIVINAEYAVGEVRQVLKMSNEVRHQIVISGNRVTIQQLSHDFPGSHFVPPRMLKVTELDLVDKFGSIDAADEFILERLAAGEVVSYEELCNSANQRWGLGKLNRPNPLQFSNVPGCLTKDGADLVDVLSRNEKWKLAFDVALETQSDKINDLLDRAGEDALQRGELVQFRRKLGALPKQAHTAGVLYWELVADLRLGRDVSRRPEVVLYLETEEAPRLRALAQLLGYVDAEYGPREGSQLDSDLTLAVYNAHLLSFSSSPIEAVEQLRVLVRQFERMDRKYRLMQTMNVLANTLVLAGEYQEAVQWGLRAGRIATELGLGSYETAIWTGTTAYAQILMGNLEAAGELLSRNHEAEKLLGRPFAEGIVSTIGDYFTAVGHLETALTWYNRVANESIGQSKLLVLPEIALVLTRLNRLPEAIDRVEAASIEVSPDEIAYAWVILAKAITLAMDDEHHATQLLQKLLTERSGQLSAPMRARAAILLALLFGNGAKKDEKLKVLDAHAHVIAQLGNSGWTTMTADSESALSLKREWESSRSPLTVELLGPRPRWRYKNSNSDQHPGLRLKELILVLICSPHGLTGEQINELMGWNYASGTTVRNHVSRLRKLIPVETRPYRLRIPIEADVLKLMNALSAGELDHALALYRRELLPESDAPFIVSLRQRLESEVKHLTATAGSPENLAKLALEIREDLDLTELALSRLPMDSHLRGRLEAQATSTRVAWDAE